MWGWIIFGFIVVSLLITVNSATNKIIDEEKENKS